MANIYLLVRRYGETLRRRPSALAGELLLLLPRRPIAGGLLRGRVDLFGSQQRGERRLRIRRICRSLREYFGAAWSYLRARAVRRPR